MMKGINGSNSAIPTSKIGYAIQGLIEEGFGFEKNNSLTRKNTRRIGREIMATKNPVKR
ncbi:MAG: hypothetical protein WCG83_04025 [Candidatus Peregrinibacteria bacterium]